MRSNQALQPTALAKNKAPRLSASVRRTDKKNFILLFGFFAAERYAATPGCFRRSDRSGRLRASGRLVPRGVGFEAVVFCGRRRAG